MRIKDRDFDTFVSQTQLAEAVCRVARCIDSDYAGKRPLLCPVLTGSFVFAADLIRNLTVDFEIAFVKYSSYIGTSSSGCVACQMPFPANVKGRDVIIVEDIVETGLSMERMIEDVRKLEPNSVKVCTLFLKPTVLAKSPSVKSLHIDYVGMEITDEFIVGYGLDYDGYGRGLKEVMKIGE